jgi:PAS domain S-box-containing protein
MLLIEPETGSIINANPAACAFYGYTREELTHLKISDINQLSPQQVFEEMERAKQEKRQQFFFRHQLASGELREVEVYSGPIQFQGKSLLYSIIHDITERRRAEEQFRLVVEASPNALMLINAAHQITLVNAQAEALFGYTREELIGQPVNLLIPPQFRSQHDDYGQAFFAAPEIRSMGTGREMFGWRKDGSQIPVEIGLTPLTTSEGLFVLTTIVDITQRKQIEESLRRSERTLKLFVEYAPAAIAMFDRNMIYMAASRRYLADYHLKDQNLVGRSHYDIFPDIPERWKEIHRRCLAGATEICVEDPFPREDGRLDWVRWEIHPWYDHNTEIGGIILFSEVITQRKQAEAQIQVQAKRLQVLADASRVFAEVSTDYQMMLERVAHTAARQLGAFCIVRLLSDDGQWLEPMIIHHQDPAVQEVLQSLIENIRVHVDDPKNPAVQVVRRGQPLLMPVIDPERMRVSLPPEIWPLFDLLHPHSLVVTPLQIQRHSIGGLAFWRYQSEQPAFNEDDLRLAQDLADRAALAIGNARLFRQVQNELAERKQAEEELRRTAMELTRSNTELEQFAYVASHDLQEPLRAVAGMMQLLQKRAAGQLDDRSEEFIRHALEGTARMQRLLTDLLAYSRVGTRGRDFQPTDLTALLGEVLANLRAAIQESGAIITHDPLPTVMADHTQLMQLFQNLIGNAIKFRHQSPPLIHIGAAPQKGQWLFTVRDNGIGMEAQYFERIFGVFQRLHTRQEYQGSGIGLAICKKIVERHGGRIWVESTPGQGSTFYFTLPHGEMP